MKSNDHDIHQVIFPEKEATNSNKKAMFLEEKTLLEATEPEVMFLEEERPLNL